MENIQTVYYLKDDHGSDLPDTSGVKMVMTDGMVMFVPSSAGNRHWQMYQEWVAAENTPQTEA